MPKLVYALALALPLVAAACGGGQRSSSTVTVDEAYDFGAAESFLIVQMAPPEGMEQGHAEWSRRYDAAFGAALRDELLARGLTESPEGQPADLVLAFTYGGARRMQQIYTMTEAAPIRSVEGKIVVEARDGESVDRVVWRNDVDFFLQEEWPPIERAEANAPTVVGTILATFPIAKQETAPADGAPTE